MKDIFTTEDLFQLRDNLPLKGIAMIAIDTVIRVKYSGTNPTLTDGFVYEDGIIIPLAGRDNLQKLRIIGLEAGKQHILWVQYYRSAGNSTGT